jgi:hypothetical protein
VGALNTTHKFEPLGREVWFSVFKSWFDVDGNYNDLKFGAVL